MPWLPRRTEVGERVADESLWHVHQLFEERAGEREKERQREGGGGGGGVGFFFDFFFEREVSV
jgi:glycerate kinase